MTSHILAPLPGLAGWGLLFFWQTIMAWSKEALQPIGTRKPPTDERFADLLRKVSSGDMDKEEAWRIWHLIKDKDCPSCEGYGGLAFVGSTGPGIPCGTCNGTGKKQ